MLEDNGIEEWRLDSLLLVSNRLFSGQAFLYSWV
jgi:hypothetical protein